MHRGGEIGRVVASQGHQQAVAQELEVDGIHTQLVGMQVAQSRQGTGQVIEVACSIGQSIGDLLAVTLDLGRAVAYIKVREVGLGGGEASKHPFQGFSSIFSTMATNLPPGSLDVAFVFPREHHGFQSSPRQP
ncbi:unnamed protein product [Litomosoides sigmodontis]|uniref:Uncharacterized protein n=1 Tax=Litomosoides sigmodontis TaxID=42156 RepID=A0A3P7JY60_LITSI|nr:unnamed protein product [Litomosoides sigmodontis]